MKDIYTDAPHDIAEAIDLSIPVGDFLPSPKELSGKVKKQRITFTINERGIKKFKEFADKK